MAEAKTNGFCAIAYNEPLFRAVALQLAMQASGQVLTLAQLQDQAKANGFCRVAMNKPLWRALVLQLACDSGGG